MPADAVRCPACSSGSTTQRETYRFRPTYLCAVHLSIWKDADRHAHVGGKCPHSPLLCPCGCGRELTAERNVQ